jgi:ATP-dependent DNA helicase RecG
LYTEDLKAGRAVSRRYRNRRIGEFLREPDMTEGRSTGIPKILKEMRANGSPAPLFETTDDGRLAFVIRLSRHPLAINKASSTAQVTEEVERLLCALNGEMSRQELINALGMTHREHFRNAYLKPALDAGVIEMTLPDKPRSNKQRYRRTAHGQRWLDKHSDNAR